MPNQMHSSLETQQERAVIEHDDFLNERVFPVQSTKVLIDKDRLKEGYPAFKLFFDVGMSKSKGDARRLINQGGAYINGGRVKCFDQKITLDDVVHDQIILRVGKKRYLTVYLREGEMQSV